MNIGFRFTSSDKQMVRSMAKRITSVTALSMNVQRRYAETIGLVDDMTGWNEGWRDRGIRGKEKPKPQHERRFHIIII